MKYKINIENLTKKLDENIVLDNINITFEEGKVTFKTNHFSVYVVGAAKKVGAKRDNAWCYSQGHVLEIKKKKALRCLYLGG